MLKQIFKHFQYLLVCNPKRLCSKEEKGAHQNLTLHFSYIDNSLPQFCAELVVEEKIISMQGGDSLKMIY